MPTTDPQLEDLCINPIRMLSADAVQNANSGHPGMPMGAAAMAYTLWTRIPEAQSRKIRTGSIATASCFPPATAPCCSTACCT